MKLTVDSKAEHIKLKNYLIKSRIEFKCSNPKQDRPLKVLIRGLSSCTSPVFITSHLERLGFHTEKITRLTKFRTKQPMPLFYLQVTNSLTAEKIYGVTALLGTRASVER
ncbi:nucleic-acid-binding protein from transposon X-element [Caerostris darwini]|uniref:Nucleic-acid-binding protein from transposon X-element n=1 Tax=Caerostris darwini TaxID=1538125 RepID=A0AAV4MFR6_9ARAC|nr:nucleic-acid-binding protein from transposon X-element [Caerostris darwini]